MLNPSPSAKSESSGQVTLAGWGQRTEAGAGLAPAQEQDWDVCTGESRFWEPHVCQDQQGQASRVGETTWWARRLASGWTKWAAGSCLREDGVLMSQQPWPASPPFNSCSPLPTWCPLCFSMGFRRCKTFQTKCFHGAVFPLLAEGNVSKGFHRHTPDSLMGSLLLWGTLLPNEWFGAKAATELPKVSALHLRCKGRCLLWVCELTIPKGTPQHCWAHSPRVFKICAFLGPSMCLSTCAK